MLSGFAAVSSNDLSDLLQNQERQDRGIHEMRISIFVNFIFTNNCQKNIKYLLSRRFLDRHFNIWRIWFVYHPTRQRRVIDSNYILKMLKCLSKNVLDNKYFIFLISVASLEKMLWKHPNGFLCIFEAIFGIFWDSSVTGSSSFNGKTRYFGNFKRSFLEVATLFSLHLWRYPWNLLGFFCFFFEAAKLFS